MVKGSSILPGVPLPMLLLLLLLLPAVGGGRTTPIKRAGVFELILSEYDLASRRALQYSTDTRLRASTLTNSLPHTRVRTSTTLLLPSCPPMAGWGAPLRPLLLRPLLLAGVVSAGPSRLAAAVDLLPRFILG